MGYEPTTTVFGWDALTDWAIRPWVQLGLRANLVQLLQFHSFFNVLFPFGYCLCQVSLLFHSKFCWRNRMSVAAWVDTYWIHHWRIIWSNYRKLAWAGFKCTATKFRSDQLSSEAMSSTRSQNQLCTATLISSFAQCHISFRLLAWPVTAFALIKILLR